MERAVIIVKGRVQKAGYRDFIDETAFNLDLTGRVKNMEDGSVEVVCEGPREKIQELVKKIHIKQYPFRVESIDVKYSKAAGEYTDFEIIRNENVKVALYEKLEDFVECLRRLRATVAK